MFKKNYEQKTTTTTAPLDPMGGASIWVMAITVDIFTCGRKTGFQYKCCGQEALNKSWPPLAHYQPSISKPIDANRPVDDDDVGALMLAIERD